MLYHENHVYDNLEIESREAERKLATDTHRPTRTIELKGESSKREKLCASVSSVREKTYL